MIVIEADVLSSAARTPLTHSRRVSATSHCMVRIKRLQPGQMCSTALNG